LHRAIIFQALKLIFKAAWLPDIDIDAIGRQPLLFQNSENFIQRFGTNMTLCESTGGDDSIIVTMIDIKRHV
jgi:hypothetical protein